MLLFILYLLSSSLASTEHSACQIDSDPDNGCASNPESYASLRSGDGGGGVEAGEPGGKQIAAL